MLVIDSSYSPPPPSPHLGKQAQVNYPRVKSILPVKPRPKESSESKKSGKKEIKPEVL